MRKKILLMAMAALTAAGVLCCCGSPQRTGNGVEAHGRLRVQDARLTDEHGEPAVLRGMSSHGISWFPRYLNGGAMKTLREEGANLMRIAVYTEPPGAYIEDPQRSLDYLYMGIESALAEDMYVIVDWHILKDGDPNELADEAAAFFDGVSAHYGNCPGILYEICNEPNGGTQWEDIVRYARRVIPVIRANAPEAVILTGVPNYCTDFRGPLADPLPYENIMYTMHRYIDVAQKKPCDPGQLEALLDQGLPIFVTEWGVTLGDADPSAEEAEENGLRQTEIYVENALPFLELMADREVSWAAWALSGKDEIHSVLRADCGKLSGWTREDLTGFGELVFDHFQ